MQPQNEDTRGQGRVASAYEEKPQAVQKNISWSLKKLKVKNKTKATETVVLQSHICSEPSERHKRFYGLQGRTSGCWGQLKKKDVHLVAPLPYLSKISSFRGYGESKWQEALCAMLHGP